MRTDFPSAFGFTENPISGTTVRRRASSAAGVAFEAGEPEAGGESHDAGGHVVCREFGHRRPCTGRKTGARARPSEPVDRFERGSRGTAAFGPTSAATCPESEPQTSMLPTSVTTMAAIPTMATGLR